MVRRIGFVCGFLVAAGMVIPVGMYDTPAWGQDDWDVPKKAAEQPVQQQTLLLRRLFSMSGCFRGGRATKSKAEPRRCSPCKLRRSPALADFPPPSGRNCNWRVNAT